MLTSQGGNQSATAGVTDSNAWIANAPGIPPAPEALSNLTRIHGGRS